MLGIRLVQFCAVFATSWCLAEAEMSVRKESARLARSPSTDAYEPSLNDATSFTEAEQTNETKTAILDINGCFPVEHVKSLIPHLLGTLMEHSFGLLTSKTLLDIIADVDQPDFLCVGNSFRVKQRVQYEYTDNRDVMQIRNIFNTISGEGAEKISDNDVTNLDPKTIRFLKSYLTSLQVNQQLTHEDQRDTIGWFLTQNNGPKTLLPGSIDESITTPTTDTEDSTRSSTDSETTDPTSTKNVILVNMDFEGCMTSFRTFNGKEMERILREDDESASVYSNSEYVDPDLQGDGNEMCTEPGSIYVSYMILISSREDAIPSYKIGLLPHVSEDGFVKPGYLWDESWDQLKQLFDGLKAVSRFQRDTLATAEHGWYMRTHINGSSI